MDFQHSLTYANLQRAYEIELMSSTKYSIYSQQARQEGYIQIGNAFDVSTIHERQHAITFLKLMNNCKIPDTLTNLIESSATEFNKGNKLYLEFAQVAREEGYENIAAIFNGISNIEINREVMFQYFADLIRENAVFCKTEETLWICTACGNIMGGLCAPEICPICGFPQGYYQVYSPPQ